MSTLEDFLNTRLFAPEDRARIAWYPSEETIIACKDEWQKANNNISELENAIIELKEELECCQMYGKLYMNRMLEAREDNERLRKAYSNTRQTLSNFALGWLEGEIQQIAFNELKNIDHALATATSWCICYENPLEEKHLIQFACPIHGKPK